MGSIDWSAAEAAPQQSGSIDWSAADTAPVVQPQQAAPVPPSLVERVRRAGLSASAGLQSAWDGAAQLLYNSMPGPVRDAGNAANDWLASHTGMVAPVGSNGPNAITAQNQATYENWRKDTGGSGIDWAHELAKGVPYAAAASLFPEASPWISGPATGAASGLASPQNGGDYWSQAGKNALYGGAGGLVGTAATKAISGAIAPQVSDAANNLLQNGVRLTPGQIIGGAVKNFEDKLTSVPLLGDAIKSSQSQAVRDFNQATYNQVLQPLGVTLPKTTPVGSEGIQAVKGAISNSYDNVLPQLQFRADPQFMGDLQGLAQKAQALPDQQRATFIKTLQTQFLNKAPQGQMNGPTLKGAMEELGDRAAGYSGDPSFDNRQLGGLLSEAKSAVSSSLQRNNAPELSQQLANTDAAYARFVRLRAAAASSGANNQGNVFSAAQLNAATRAADKSAGKGATATGNALMQDWAQGAQGVLGNTYPDSGTAGRGALLGLLAGGAGMGAHEMAPEAMPYIAGAAGLAGAGMLPYTSLGGRAVRWMLTPRESTEGLSNLVQGTGGRIASPLFGQLAVSGSR